MTWLARNRIATLAVGAAAIGGCSSAADAQAGEGAVDETAGAGSGPETGDGDGEGDAYDLGQGDEGTGEATTGAPNDFLGCEPFCGEHGTCVDIGEELGLCDCDDGYEYAGPAGCVPCPVVDAEHDIDVTVLEVSVVVTISGASPPASEYDDGNLWLENPRRGDRVYLGSTHDAALSTLVVPGIYDVVYEHEDGGALVPLNKRAILQTLEVQEDLHLELDLDVVTVQGAITINGEAPAQNEYDDADIVLRDPVSGADTVVGDTKDGSWSATLIRGDYDAYYRLETGGDTVPVNEWASLGPVSVVSPETLVPIEIEAHAISGAITVDGAPPPASDYDDGLVVLRGPGGDRARLANTHDQSYSALVIDGDYELYFELETGGVAVPRNRAGLVGPFPVHGGGPQPIDIPRVAFAGEFRINGAAPPGSEYDDGLVYLRNLHTGDEVLLGNTHDGSFDVGVVPGTYDVFYSGQTVGAVMPRNVGAWVVQLGIEADQSQNIDIPAVSLAGDFTIDGLAPPDSEYADARVYLRRADPGDSVLLGNTKDGSYSAVLVPGLYDVHYVEETSGMGVPGNQDAQLSTVMVAGPMSYDVDIPTATMSGAFTIGGGAPPATPSASGSVYLRAGADSILLGATHQGDYAASVVSGGYGIYFRREGTGQGLPENENGRIGCITVP